VSTLVVVASVSLAAWTAIVAIVSLWAVCEPIVRPALARVRERLWPWAKMPKLESSSLTALLLRPCAGSDANLARNLRSIADARRDGILIRCVFAVHDERDAAYAEALSAQEWLSARGIDCRLAVTRAEGPNHKVDQLARAQAMADRDGSCAVVLVVDSDVDLSGVDLGPLVAPLVDGSRAAVWSPVPERGERGTLGDRASVAILSGGLHSFAILSRLDPAGMVGKLFAVRADALADVGGFSALRRHLGEDVELSRRLRALELHVSAVGLGAFSSAEGRTVAGTRDRYARWLLVVRTQRPSLLASYPMLFFAAPLQVLSALLLALFAPWIALAVALVAVFARVLVAAVARSASRLRPSLRATLIDPWIGDVLLAFAWAKALTLREVSWRSSKIRFDRDGLLVAVDGERERGAGRDEAPTASP